MISDAVRSAQWPVVALAFNLDDARRHEVGGDAKRVLALATLAFTLCFAVWVMFAIVGIPIAEELALTEGQFALLAAIPVLTGSLLRVPAGMLTDRIGGRVAMTVLLLIVAPPTYLVGRIDTTDSAAAYHWLLVLALFIGLAGTSFAIGVSWGSAWFPERHKGFALGVIGTGNVGASITKLLAPTLIAVAAGGGLLGGLVPGGWRLLPAVYALAMTATAAAVWTLAPRPEVKPAGGRSLREMSAPLARMRVWRFGLYYVSVFGAYVALALWLPKYYVDVYSLELHSAGLLTALFIFPASLLRPLGGALSDKFGARSVTIVSLSGVAIFAAALCLPMGVEAFTALICAAGAAMGVGKASVYAYIPRYFPRDVGAVGGLVGAIGGVGGFLLPLAFASVVGTTGSPQSTFAVVAALATAGVTVLLAMVVRMRAPRPISAEAGCVA